MKSIFASIVIVLSCFQFPATAGNLKAKTQQAISQAPVRYWLYQPRIPEQEKLPLVLFLHGGGEGGDDLELVKKHGLPQRIAEGAEFPFIMVAPQNPERNKFWDDQILIRLVDELETTLPVDSDRIYLMGMSRGAYGAWRLAIQNPDRFAALVAVCGGGDVPYVRKIKKIPTWVFHGAKDEVIPISESQMMVEALQKAGGNVRFTIYPEADHDSWTETFHNPEVYEWMLKQKRPTIAE